jgi:thiopeptide-type bacteriocin biosynthesis protein
MPMERKWDSLHIFYHDFSKVESLLLEAIHPKIVTLIEAGQLQQWFYMRYWEGGPHIRLRLLNASENALLEIKEEIEKYLQANKPELLLQKEDYYRNHKFDGEEISLQDLPWYENGEVASIEYVPELGRYGGEAAIVICEELFYRSSELTINILKLTGTERNKRMGISLDVMMLTALLLNIEKENLSEYFTNYSMYWERFVDHLDKVTQGVQDAYSRQRNSLDKRLIAIIDLVHEQSKAEHPLYSPWIQAVSKASHSFKELSKEYRLDSPYTGQVAQTEEEIKRAIQSICFSQIHMTNNRMGVYPSEEFYLGKMIGLLSEKSMSKEL